MASGGAPVKYNIRYCQLQKWQGVPSIGFSLENAGKPPHWIGTVDSNSPASTAGLRIGDAIIEVNDKDFSSSDYAKLQKAVGEAIREKGKINLLVVEKQNYEAAKKEKLLKKKSAQILSTPAMIPPDIVNFPKNTPRTCNIQLGSGDQTFGFELVQAQRDIGAVIQHINPNTPATRTALLKCDRIIEINDEFVNELPYNDIRQRLAQAKAAGALKLYVMDTDTYKHYKAQNLPLQSGADDGQGQYSNDQDDDSDEGGDPPGARPPSYHYTNIKDGRDDGDDSDDDERISRAPSNPRGGATVGSGLAGLPVGPRTDIRECTITRANATQPLGFALTFSPPDYPTLTVSREGGQLKNPTTAGLVDGDSVIEVNGRPTRGVPENDVKQGIKNSPYPQPVVLLVADPATVRHYDSIGQPITNRLPNVRHIPERTDAAVVARPAKPRRDGASIAGLIDNPLTGARPPSHDLYENQDQTPRGSTRVVAGQRTCLLRSSPDSKGMGLSLNNQEPDGTPHRVTVVTENSPAARAGLKRDDILISINDTNVERLTRAQVTQTLRDAIGQEKSNGTPVKFVVREDLPSRAPSVASSQAVSRRPTQTDRDDTVSIVSAALPANQRAYVLRSSPDFQGLGFGLNLSEPEGTPYRLTLVKPNSPAQRENLRVGDTLISINDQNVERLPRAEVKRLLQEAIDREKTQRTPVKLVVLDETAPPPARTDTVSSSDTDRTRPPSTIVPPRPRSPAQPAVQPQDDQRLVSVKRDPRIDGIGIDVDSRHTSDNPRRITRVTPLSPAAAQGIREGDMIVAINGKSVRGMSGDMIRLELTKALQREKDGGPAMELIIEPGSPMDTDTDDDTPPPISQPPSDQRKPSTTRPINTGRDPLATVPATSVRPHDDRRPSYNDRGKYDVPKQESPYQTMKEANDTSIASTRSTQRDRTQVDLVSGDQMYRVYHLNVKPGHSFGFDFETEGNRHLICRLERGCEAERRGLADNDQIVEVNEENVLGKPNRTVYHALRQASMKGYLVLVVYPRSVRALTKRSEKSLSSMNLHNGGLNTTLSSSVGDLSSAAAIRSRRDWNFEESPFRQLPDPLKDPTDPLPRTCVLFKDSSSAGCGVRLIEKEGYDTPIVLEITPNSPARRSGLAVGDHIVYIDQQNVQALRSFRDKTNLIQDRFTRNNRVTLIALTAAAYRVLHQRGGVLKPGTFDYQTNKPSPLRLRLSELILFDHEDDFGFSVYPNSATYIREVHAASAAAEDGLTKNDKIVELNGEDTSELTARQIEKMIRDSRTGRRITLLTVDPEGYEYAVRHGIPLHSDLPLVERPRGQRTHREHRYTNSVAL